MATQSGDMVNRHKNMAMGKSVKTGADSVPSMPAPRTNPNRGMSHAPLADSDRACSSPMAGGGGSMHCQSNPDHGPQYHK